MTKRLKGVELWLNSSSGPLQTFFTISYKERAFWMCIIVQQNSHLLMWWLPLSLLHLHSQWLTMSTHIVNTKLVNMSLPFRTKGKFHYLFCHLNAPFCSGEKHFEHFYFDTILGFFFFVWGCLFLFICLVFWLSGWLLVGFPWVLFFWVIYIYAHTGILGA